MPVWEMQHTEGFRGMLLTQIKAPRQSVVSEGVKHPWELSRVTFGLSINSPKWGQMNILTYRQENNLNFIRCNFPKQVFSEIFTGLLVILLQSIEVQWHFTLQCILHFGIQLQTDVEDISSGESDGKQIKWMSWQSGEKWSNPRLILLPSRLPSQTWHKTDSHLNTACWPGFIEPFSQSHQHHRTWFHSPA